MEALPAAQDDSSGANPSSVKSDDSSPRPDSRAGSPPPNCAICLGTCKNKSFTDSCLHQFCFTCLLTWSKVKAECPLCKQAFRSIIHNVRSNHQYEEYLVVQRQSEEATPAISRVDIDRVTAATQRFRYRCPPVGMEQGVFSLREALGPNSPARSWFRTTLTLPRRETVAIQQLLRHYPFMADVFPPPGGSPPARRRRSPASFRRTVYRHNLWARPLPDFTGRFRTCTPEFYRYNDTQMHRLVPWLNRELHYLLNENIGHISYVMSRILELLPQHHINSPEFRESLNRYFGDRTEHFLHELYCFASTPYDITGYDRNVQYTTDSRISTMVNEVISSSDSDASVDSDIVMVSSSEPAEPPAGPSRLPVPTYPQGSISQPATDNVIPIETISQSDTDDDSSEVMVVGYIKPPQERTPEIVDLLGSDSDVIVQDAPAAAAGPAAGPPEPRASTSVKLTLKRHRAPEPRHDSDSDDASYRPPPRRRARVASASTSDTSCSTPSPTPPPSRAKPTNSRLQPACKKARRLAAHARRGTFGMVSSDEIPPSPSTVDTSTSCGDDTDDTKYVDLKKSQTTSGLEITTPKDRKRSKRRSTHSRHKENVRKILFAQAAEKEKEKEKRSKRKSYSGKGVKSSKKASNTEQSVPAGPVLPALDQPSTSGTSKRDKQKKRKTVKERKRQRRDSREKRRLRSVVKVMYNSHKTADESNSSANYSSVSTATRSRSDVESATAAGDSQTGTADSANKRSERPTTSRRVACTSSDSEDNLPLNLTLQKINSFSSS
ncbi:hypothetical protein PYW07_007390 [Mythimna separata]|uniref:E3 ubiquitin-protein ligase Topors n=1 Tax=Mythimna separata TaxID=271217 RepID=A0AAD7Z284_MYTSE|nr:hypothetical protein PYW07_007390 [Mythimna separata]